MFSTVISALCGCYNDTLVKSSDVSLHTFNMAMYVVGFVLNLAYYVVKRFFDDAEPKFFDGYTGSGLGVLFLNSGIGLLITAVYKYGDAIIKSLASTVSTAMLMILSGILFGHPLRITSSLGCAIILMAALMYVYFGSNKEHCIVTVNRHSKEVGNSSNGNSRKFNRLRRKALIFVIVTLVALSTLLGLGNLMHSAPKPGPINY